MWKEAKPMFIIAETPIHPGSGSELGIVDLPIQRERHTNFPKIEGSSLKGSIREIFEQLIDKSYNLNGNKTSIKKDLIEIIFGPDEGDKFSGSVAFTDAKILLFPVKSLKGIFGWITCPFVLERFKQDLSISHKQLFEKMKTINFTEITNTIGKSSNLIISSKIVLEEFTFEIQQSEKTSELAKILSENIFPSDEIYSYWKQKLQKDLIILTDDDFRDFITHSTEVITRTKIDSKTGTIQTGALWTEEYIPQDTIFYSVIATTDPKNTNNNQDINNAKEIINFLKSHFSNTVIQIGGNQSIGKGFAKIKIMED